MGSIQQACTYIHDDRVQESHTQRVNTIMVQRQFTGQVPLTTVPCLAVCDSEEILPTVACISSLLKTATRPPKLSMGKMPLLSRIVVIQY